MAVGGFVLALSDDRETTLENACIQGNIRTVCGLPLQSGPGTENDMTVKWIVVLFATLAIAGADSSAAHTKHAKKPRCVAQPVAAYPSLGTLLFGYRPAPQPNGCSPPTYENGRFLGQDPDPNIRFQLQRDPDESYWTR
jgi:hypothetical protein